MCYASTARASNARCMLLPAAQDVCSTSAIPVSSSTDRQQNFSISCPQLPLHALVHLLVDSCAIKTRLSCMKSGACCMQGLDAMKSGACCMQGLDAMKENDRADFFKHFSVSEEEQSAYNKEHPAPADQPSPPPAKKQKTVSPVCRSVVENSGCWSKFRPRRKT